MKMIEAISEINALKGKIEFYDQRLKALAKVPKEYLKEKTKEEITFMEIAMVKAAIELNRYYEMEVSLHEGERYEEP